MKPWWLIEAEQYIGLKEIPGTEHEPTILKWLYELKAWWRDDETPWCGLFVAHCLSSTALPQHWYRARAWLDWGIKLDFPTVGCVVIYERKGGGHVGFLVGRDANGNLMTLGGNQGNKVSIAPFPYERVLGFRWPNKEVLNVSPLPLINSDGKISTNEA